MRALTIFAIAIAALTASATRFAQSGVAAAAAENAAPLPASEPVAVVDRYFDALSAGDTRTATALLDPAVVIYESGNVEHSRGEYAAHHLAADAAFLHSATHGIVSRSSDTVGDLAWVATEARFTTIGVTPTDSMGTETMILRRQPGGWRIVHIHWSSRSVLRQIE